MDTKEKSYSKPFAICYRITKSKGGSNHSDKRDHCVSFNKSIVTGCPGGCEGETGGRCTQRTHLDIAPQ